jgi:hypothetical protein
MRRALHVLAASGVTAWTPAALANLAAWYDASDAGSFTFSSGTVVAQWADLSGNGRHLTQATTGFQPSRSGTLNGLPAVVFDGADDALNYSTDVAWGTRHSMAIVSTPSTGTDDYILRLRTVASGEFAFISKYSSRSYEFYTAGAIGITRTILGSASLTGHNALVVSRDGTTVTPTVNGATQTTVTVGASTMTTPIYVANLGQSNVNNGGITVGEIVLTASALSGGDLTNLSAYLRTKWGTP